MNIKFLEASHRLTQKYSLFAETYGLDFDLYINSVRQLCYASIYRRGSNGGFDYYIGDIGYNTEANMWYTEIYYPVRRQQVHDRIDRATQTVLDCYLGDI